MINEILEFWLLKSAGYVVLNSLWLGGILGIIFWISWKFVQRYSSSFRYVLLLSFFLIFAASNLYFLFDTFPVSRHASTSGSLKNLPHSEAIGFSPGLQPYGKVNILAGIKSSSYYVNQYKAHFGVFWLIGFLLLSIRFLGGYYYLQRIKGSGIQLLDQTHLTFFKELVHKIGIKQNVDLMESSKINNPMTIGYWSPIILVPLGMMATIPPAQLEAILLHELYHIRNRDYLVNIFQSLICIIFFYHPLVWWLSKRIDEEREYICDDATISFSENPMALARALTFLQEHQLHLNNHLAMSLSGNKSKFKNRVYRLFNPGKQGSSKVASLYGLAIVLMMATAFTFIHVQKTETASTLKSSQSLDLKNTFFQNPENGGDSSNVLLSALNFNIIVKDGKLQIVIKEGMPSEPLLVVDGRFLDLKEIAMVDPEDIASMAIHKSEMVSEGVIAIHTNEYRDIRFRGFVKSATEKRTYPVPEHKTPLFIYMIEGKEVTEEKYNEIEHFLDSYEGIGVEDALIRYGIKGKNGAVILNKRIY